MMLRETVPGFESACCYAIACPACMTKELAASCKDYVTSIIHASDIVPTFSGVCRRQGGGGHLNVRVGKGMEDFLERRF